MSSAGKEIWVYIDRRRQSLFEQSLKVLGKAGELSRSAGGRAVALLFSSEGGSYPSCLPMDEACGQCFSCGADLVMVIDDHGRDIAAAHARYLVGLARERSPLLIAFALTEHGRSIASRCARHLETGLIADCIDMEYSQGRIIGHCSAWGGEVLAEISFKKGVTTGLATVRTHGLSLLETGCNDGGIEHVTPDAVPEPGLVPESVERDSQERDSLEQADTVVAGGAGMGDIEGFGLVRELASALGAQVGATRPAVLAHWVSEDRLIGQTGKTIRPSLLITVGTSGAVQYTAGIMDSKKIVAINRDPEAPVFAVADIGVVADARNILPLITEKVRQATMRKLADLLEEGCEGESGEGFGAKVKDLREGQGWSVEHLAESTGQSPEFILQVEKNEVTPSVAFLLRLSGALHVDPATFLTEDEKEDLRDRRARDFYKRTRNYSYQTLTPGAENMHLHGFMITIEPRQAHKPVAYKHEGEEFIYVMEGELELTLGGSPQILKPGEAVSFDSETPHKLVNASDRMTRCLVILYTP